MKTHHFLFVRLLSHDGKVGTPNKEKNRTLSHEKDTFRNFYGLCFNFLR